MIVSALLIKISSPGPVFYRQQRVGKDGRLFILCKFRTMIADAEKHVGPVLATKDDARVTPVGRVLRRTRIDELPQTYNVLRGDMSLVGPRPERPFFVERHKALQGVRLAVKPGLTGLAQVRSYYDLKPTHKVKYDILYIQKRSVASEPLHPSANDSGPLREKGLVTRHEDQPVCTPHRFPLPAAPERRPGGRCQRQTPSQSARRPARGLRTRRDLRRRRARRRQSLRPRVDRPRPGGDPTVRAAAARARLLSAGIRPETRGQPRGPHAARRRELAYPLAAPGSGPAHAGRDRDARQASSRRKERPPSRLPPGSVTAWRASSPRGSATSVWTTARRYS